MKTLKTLAMAVVGISLLSTPVYSQPDPSTGNGAGCINGDLSGIITKITVGDVGVPGQSDGSNEIWLQLDNQDSWLAINLGLNMNDVVGPSMLSMLQLAFVSSLPVILWDKDGDCMTFEEITILKQ
ncbi:hypothetical protein [uncultured Paraglaciecola sp.]|uniref:hypothetical protein n=1 Tax=uncultured Paraglaciecola sp. TaxID=1765024 RepID=UPI0030DAC7CD|tara:strand:- start:196398 stop:196775 length:378 start_codon:yes stop_codon:yes gene_type:complete